MTDTTVNPSWNDPICVTPSGVTTSEMAVSELLAQLQEVAPSAVENRELTDTAKQENQLAIVRLGIATSLFYALRTKHAPTAAHSLRVALICSAWSERMGLPHETRDRIEVASLLHDLGKIGIPDSILRKSSRLTDEEKLTMDYCPEMACEILRGCTSDAEVLNIVLFANAWFDSRRQEETLRGSSLPIGSRMLAIAGAFDSMTTNHLYRPAMRAEQALAELTAGSGTQFDPELVGDFQRMMKGSPEIMQAPVVERWLQRLTPDASNPTLPFSGRSSSPAKKGKHRVRRETRFHSRLLKDLKDGVVFTNANGVITHWNATMVKMTGIASDAIIGKTWDTQTFGICDKQATLQTTDCPLQQCLESKAPVSRAMEVRRKDDIVPVHIQVAPVSGEEPGLFGAVIILHDNSVREDLEEQIDALHLKTTLDGLTGVANRAHFDECLKRITQQTREGGKTFSLVICDIDFFKRVNDVHGHPAGDEALIAFADVLKKHCREGDLVARYGGEEFLLVAASCDNKTAAERAEAIRANLETTRLPSLGGASVTASFGVTEFQPGDDPDTILARADRALLRAKDTGRNRVVQLGGSGDSKSDGRDSSATDKSNWRNWLDAQISETTEIDIVTPVPASLTIEKLRGFIADHDSEILSVNESQVTLKVNALCSHAGGRRRSDVQISFKVELTLSEAREDEIPASRYENCTKVHVALDPIRKRDRRNSDFKGCVQRVVASLRSYLMGEIIRPQSC